LQRLIIELHKIEVISTKVSGDVKKQEELHELMVKETKKADEEKTNLLAEDKSYVMFQVEKESDRYNYRKILLSGKISAVAYIDEGPQNWITGAFYETFYVPHSHHPRAKSVTLCDGIVKFEFPLDAE